ncbi:MFS transporter [Parapusillimonas granuli]|uniref:MHS family MFS transporter n=1 Tax=Parapusillimonas granuli TaxID=380911 RepID=A0A853G154_9BURK|nr:MFS transporter [Parapusillimonas granuli]MEB2399223.1 MFS transporter [Alcaligenaceae bacterium]NYT50998.1 MHS family MFS transporter [Parapusillimonas granuli]
MTPEERRVIFASSLGTVFEWYDFYLYGSLAAIIAAHFFSGVNPTAGFIFALLAFAAGFAVRPFGALVFGRLGDMVGRKYTFLITILIMGMSTFLVGVLPSYASIGMAAPVILIVLRLLQGLALGGEYGGAATYVAEHAPQNRRGFYTSWIQTTATMGLFLSLLVILGIRTSLGEEAFLDWGWRIPFLISVVLLGISVWIRMQLNESPAFRKMKEEGTSSKAPIKESFGKWGNLKIVLLALFGLTAGQAVVWYTGQFYALFFLTKTLALEANTANIMIALALLLGTPFFVVFGALSDRIGRKPIIMAGCLIAAVAYFPVFKAITHFANPALEHAQATAPVTVIADPATCSFQFNPVGVSSFTSSCDILKAFMASNSVNYANEKAPAGSIAKARIGDEEFLSFEGSALSKADFAAKSGELKKSLTEAIRSHGYPAKADPSQVNYIMVVLLLTFLVILVTMVYGPIAAMLVEMFPTRIRYTSMSLPYHIGNGWFGGFLPPVAFAIVAATGNIYHGLWYPIIVAVMTLVVGALFVRETKDNDINS